MKKTLLLSTILIFIFSGCFSLQSQNPLSYDKKKIMTPNNAPLWLEKRYIKNHISAIGATKNIDKEEFNFYKKRALLSAGNNLLKKVYIKTVNIYKEYVKEQKDIRVFDKDIKKVSEHIALKALNASKVKHTWQSEDKELFVQLAVDTNFIAEQIQLNSKQLFEKNIALYQNFLSNRAKTSIMKKLEK